jgi:UDP-N-acetylmuramoyl-tripeptide--D-alanyl-D-alanine ligase
LNKERGIVLPSVLLLSGTSPAVTSSVAILSAALFLLLGAFAWFFWGDLRQSLHMLQLHSYYPLRFLQWLKGRQRKMAIYLMAGTVITSLGLRYGSLTIYLLLHAVIFFVLALFRKKQPDKKPLVYTWRLKRLLFTAIVVCILFLLGLGVLFRSTFFWELPFLLAFMNLMVHTIVIIANVLNSPLEKHIARGFTADAKKILAGHPGLKVVGVTGSYGKTSTKHLLSQLLAADYQVLATPESYNTPMGVVRTIRERLAATHQILIVEMGAKKAGDIKEICDIVRPDMGIITSIGEMHLETFESLDNIIRTKFELAAAVAKDGLLFLNDGNEYIRKQRLSQPLVRYGLAKAGEDNQQLDVWSENISSGPEGSQFDLRFADGGCVACRTRLLGRLNVLNITAAAAVAARLGVTPAALSQAIGRLEAIPHRLQLLPPGPRYQIIDDAFNSNPEGAKQALETLGGFPGYRVVITPGMVELGEKEEELNRRLGRQAARHCDFIIIVGKNRAGAIEDGARLAGYNLSNLYVAADIQDALRQADRLAGDLEQEEGPMTVLLENDLPDNYLDNSKMKDSPNPEAARRK